MVENRIGSAAAPCITSPAEILAIPGKNWWHNKRILRGLNGKPDIYLLEVAKRRLLRLPKAEATLLLSRFTQLAAQHADGTALQRLESPSGFSDQTAR